MTQPDNTGVDANDVLDELVAYLGRLAKENAILRAQLKARPTIESGTPEQ